MSGGTPAVFFIWTWFLAVWTFRVGVKTRSNRQVPHLSAARKHANEPNHPMGPSVRGRDNAVFGRVRADSHLHVQLRRTGAAHLSRQRKHYYWCKCLRSKGDYHL